MLFSVVKPFSVVKLFSEAIFLGIPNILNANGEHTEKCNFHVYYFR